MVAIIACAKVVVAVIYIVAVILVQGDRRPVFTLCFTGKFAGNAVNRFSFPVSWEAG